MKKESNIEMERLAEHLRREQPHLLRYACYRLGNLDNAKDALQDTYLKLCGMLSSETSRERLAELHLSGTLKHLYVTAIAVKPAQNDSIRRSFRLG